MIMAAASPGIFGGDCLEQIIRVDRGAHVRLTSQSALQVHAAPDGATARIANAYHIEDAGGLRCQWDPLIPFADARLDQRLEMHIAGTGYLCWSDAMTAGRSASGERWRFATVEHELKVFFAGSLEYLERYCIDRQHGHLTRAWTVGDATYLGTAFALGLEFEEGAAERLHNDLATIPDLRAAVSLLQHRMLLVRLIGRSGPPFHQARSRVERALAPNR
jgi:urease accessory protein UreH